MADPAPTCRECGGALDGRDVYEGICRSCREEVVLGRRPSAAKRSPAPAPPPRPDLPASVSMDEDTKEMETVAPAAQEPPAHDPVAVVSEPEEEGLTLPLPESDDVSAAAEPPAPPVLDDEDDVDLMPSILAPEPEQAAPASEARSDSGSSEVLLDLQLPHDDEPSPPAKPKAPADEPPPITIQLRDEDDDDAEPTVVFEPAQAPTPSPDILPMAPKQPREDTGGGFSQEHVRHAVERLERDVDRLATELDLLRRGGHTPTQQMAHGFR
ncbi:hypothetical protein HQ576_09475, partial [bacterium]|nr:hypothetical protein [bacterium]